MAHREDELLSLIEDLYRCLLIGRPSFPTDSAEWDATMERAHAFLSPAKAPAPEAEESIGKISDEVDVCVEPHERPDNTFGDPELTLQLQFISWLEQNGMYDSYASANVMRNMFSVWRKCRELLSAPSKQ